ncbi:MAG: prenyltransferase/squalene oxidase repeat-containing protein [bacterium]
MNGFDKAIFNRRKMLKVLSLSGALAAWNQPGWNQASADTGELEAALISFLESLKRPDGGYAWEDQTHSHLTPAYAVTGCYQLLGTVPPQPDKLADYIRTHHPTRLKKLEQEHRQFEYQQIQSLLWLGADVSEFREQVSSWKTPTVYLKQYEQHGYPVFQSEMSAFTCRKLLDLPLYDCSPQYTEYLNSRRRPNGSFNNTPAADGGDGHILNTLWGLQALQALEQTDELREETIAWIQSCQLEDGSFTWQPNPPFAGVGNLTYTWAAVCALNILGSSPENREKCIEYILSLWHEQGGFSDVPEAYRCPLATYRALDALTHLKALDAQSKPSGGLPVRVNTLPDNLQVYSIQIEAHGQGSPAEAVELARALRIHLWGAKNAKPEWIQQAQRIANQQQVPVQFFVSNEEYGTWVNVPGYGTYSHTSDIIAPADSDFGPSLAKADVVSWEEFRQKRLSPLLQAKGRLIWQFGENEELVRLFLDDSIQRGGYAAISTFHFGNPDFFNSEPFLQSYRGRIPFVALQDAHGSEPWWFADMTTGFRTVFLATEPTWEGWLNALEKNWVASIRHDQLSANNTWIHAGSDEVLHFIRQHESSWRWWKNPDIRRPLVSVVSLKPQDQFETGHPETGVAIRVRCAWENTTQGLPKTPLAELVELKVDHETVTPELVAPRQPRGNAYRDYYHYYPIPQPDPGKHFATAVVRDLKSNQSHSRTIEFEC